MRETRRPTEPTRAWTTRFPDSNREPTNAWTTRFLEAAAASTELDDDDDEFKLVGDSVVREARQRLH